jgi:hypothetical protein
MRCEAPSAIREGARKGRPSESNHMKLRRGPYPDPTDNAVYFYIQAGHRQAAIDHAIQVIRDDAARAALASHVPTINVSEATISEWVVETLIQGAWLREYAGELNPPKAMIRF